ncbi:MAG: CRISPR-associated helicase Cas3' [Bacteroidales bacterium]|nr:CRISPR-associated helicase Cas3' [Bacteroidales bacterium]
MKLYDKAFFDNLLNGKSELYYAHLPKSEQAGRKPELLSEHSALTMEYARKIVENHHLADIITKLASDIIPENLENKQLLKETIEDLFWRAIAFHDLGKINHRFQQKIMQNPNPVCKVEHGFGSNHSLISAYIFLALFFPTLDNFLSNEEKLFISTVAFYIACPIVKHHSPVLAECRSSKDWSENNEEGKRCCRKDIAALKDFLHIIKCTLNEEDIERFHKFFLGNIDYLFECFDEIADKKFGFPLYALVKLEYSVLTAADYLSTAHYMNGWADMFDDFGVMDEVLRNKIITNAYNTKPYNVQTYKDLEQGIKFNPDDYAERNNKNLNVLRESLSIEVIQNIRANFDKRLFYIEAPTGGGKTNASALALAELLKNDTSLQKVFYVFPFTALITQTYKALSETLGLSDCELVEHHSKAARDFEKSTDNYKNYIDALFLNYPIVLMSHVSFFEILKTNGKDANYLMHRLSNSVVIIDEIQTYSPKIWNKVVYFIDKYATYFNMKFIVMSATLPKIGDLAGGQFVYLVKNKDSYFQNPNFCNRVEFDYSLLKWQRPEKDDIHNYLERLERFAEEKSLEYSQQNNGGVLTVIEFIFKNTAGDFYQIVKMNPFYDEVFLLSGTITEPRRKQIISKLKSDSLRDKKVMLVTTQVVEAGVDIDMDLGFKDKSLIDSEEQLAGRINRNAGKKNCKLYLFDCNTEKTIYGGDDRFKITQQLPFETYTNILETKNFDLLYSEIIKRIKEINKSKFIVNMDAFYDDISRLDYPNVDKSFEIINQKSVSVYVPMKIATSDLGDDLVKRVEDFGIECDGFISGEEIWNKYAEIIKSDSNDFILNRLLLSKLQKLMSLFTFSVFDGGKDFNALLSYGELKYGYVYLHGYEEIYSFENGIDASIFNGYRFL